MISSIFLYNRINLLLIKAVDDGCIIIIKSTLTEQAGIQNGGNIVPVSIEWYFYY